MPTNLTGVAAVAPSAMTTLGLAGSQTTEEIAARKKKLMAAAGTDPMAKYGDSAFALLGLHPSQP